MIPRDDERPRTIGLKWDGFHEEARATTATIKPGHLIELIDTPDVPRLPPDCRLRSSGAAAVLRIAIEDRLGNSAGNLAGRDINTAYANDDIVFYVTPKKGDVFQMRVVAGSAWTVGTKMAASTNGTIIAIGAGVGVAEIEETKDLDATDELIRCRVL
jgi:hypothetical protein